MDKMNNFVKSLSTRKKKRDSTDMTRQWENLRREYEQIKYQDKTSFDILHAAHTLDEQGATTFRDRKLSESSFTGVDRRSEEFRKHLTHTLRKLMILAKDDPVLVQTVIQIIQEEEQHDRDYMAKAKADDFVIVGRPKQWKVKTWEGFRQTIRNRVAQIPKEKEAPDNWLALHLERLRQAVFSDLLQIKQICVPLFPDDWDVYKDCVVCYHECITKQLEDIVQSGLEEAENAQILVWINEYTGRALLTNPTLAISDSEYLGSPLSYQTLTSLRKKYLDGIGSNLGDWLPKTLKKDVSDWCTESEPHRDGEGHFYTSYPVLTFKMINENIEQASHVRDDIKTKLVNRGLKELQANLKDYANAVTEHINCSKVKPKHNATFKKKSTVDLTKCSAYHMQHTVAILNNYYLIDRNLVQLKDTFGLSDEDHGNQLANLKNLVHEQSTECLHLFMANLEAEVKPHQDRILTKQWLDNSSTEGDPIDAICQLIKDYTCGMRMHYYTTWLWEIEKYSTQEYMRAMMDKRMVCKGETERKSVASKIFQDVAKLKALFVSLSDVKQENTEWEVVTKLAEIIDIQKTTVQPEIIFLVNLYGDMQRRHVSRLLRIRGDFGQISRRKLATDALKKPEMDSKEKIVIKETIFSAVTIK